MTKEQSAVLSIISQTLSGAVNPDDFSDDINWKTIYNELVKQGCIGLAEPLLSHDIIASDAKALFEKTISNLQAASFKVRSVQNKLCETLSQASIPFIIIKGLATAKFYPNPQLRALGDIDFYVNPESFETANSALIAAGFDLTDATGYRHNIYSFGGIIIEMHRRITLTYDNDKATALDDWISKETFSPTADNVINTSFPSASRINCGLIILEHANQHFGEGIGLRQLVDWAAYVQSDLCDSSVYRVFLMKAQQLGLDKLMHSLTRTCQLYFSLTDSIPYGNADSSSCSKLIEYIFKSGNIGKNDALTNKITAVMLNSQKDLGFLKSLQKNGEENWKLLKSNPWLRPLAWAYQLKRYVSKAFANGDSIVKAAIKAKAQAKEREELLSEFGVSCRIKEKKQQIA